MWHCYFSQSNYYGGSPPLPISHTPLLPRCSLYNIDAIEESATLQAITDCGNKEMVVSPDFICISDQNNLSDTTLINSIEHGFPKPEIHNFWEVQHHLSTDKGFVLMDSFLAQMFLGESIMLLAHQGVVCMKAYANASVHWPGMNTSICNFRANCLVCSSIAPKSTLNANPHNSIRRLTLLT